MDISFGPIIFICTWMRIVEEVVICFIMIYQFRSIEPRKKNIRFGSKHIVPLLKGVETRWIYV